MSVDMSVEFLGCTFSNPIVAASGTFGFAKEYADYFDLSLIGGVSLKALTYNETIGNPPPRIAEVNSGIINSVGLQNPGVKAFLKDIWPNISKIKTVKIANISGFSKEDYLNVIEELNNCDIDLYELNISCPNVAHGGAFFGRDEKKAYEIVSAAKKKAAKPLIVKLMPILPSLDAVAIAAEEAGADALSLINTLPAMAIDAKSKRPVLGNVTGGLSGPAIKPVALKLVYEVSKCVKIPIIGGGGVFSGEDAAEFMLAGASLVSAGTATLADPYAVLRIVDELRKYALSQGVKQIKELTNALIVG